MPHALRPFVGVQHRRLIPAAALGGGIFVLACDLLARVLPTRSEIPLGVVTGHHRRARVPVAAGAATGGSWPMAEPLLRSPDLTVRRGDREVARRSLSLAAPAGAITVLLGPNGAGKSTAPQGGRWASCPVRPGGSIRLAGQRRPRAGPARARARLCAYVPQHSALEAPAAGARRGGPGPVRPTTPGWSRSPTRAEDAAVHSGAWRAPT